MTANLRGLGKKLAAEGAVLVVVLDADERDVDEFRRSLENLAKENGVECDRVFGIAVEETEAWLLGDEKALFAAYPRANLAKYRSYKQDSVCGTWEKLADVVYRGGFKKLDANRGYDEKGIAKLEWAQKIGEKMTLDGNKSPSFNLFISELQRRIVEVGT